MNLNQHPAIGKTIDAGGIGTNYHEMGEGDPVILIHGSGVGVTGYVNWRYTMPVLSRKFWTMAPDMVGYGFSDCPPDAVYSMDYWVAHLLKFMDAKGIAAANLIGNSFGGAVALAATARHPDRVRRTVLMGSGGLEFKMSEKSNAGHGYQPSLEKMRELLHNFTYFPEQITDEWVTLRYQTSLRPGYQETFEKLFPGTREQKMRALLTPEDQIRSISRPVLLIHGREDRVVPYESSVRMHAMIDQSELHIFGRCGHWSHIDQADRFNQLVMNFFEQP